MEGSQAAKKTLKQAELQRLLEEKTCKDDSETRPDAWKKQEPGEFLPTESLWKDILQPVELQLCSLFQVLGWALVI